MCFNDAGCTGFVADDVMLEAEGAFHSGSHSTTVETSAQTYEAHAGVLSAWGMEQ